MFEFFNLDVTYLLVSHSLRFKYYSVQIYYFAQDRFWMTVFLFSQSQQLRTTYCSCAGRVRSVIHIRSTLRYTRGLPAVVRCFFSLLLKHISTK